MSEEPKPTPEQPEQPQQQPFYLRHLIDSLERREQKKRPERQR